MQEAIERIQRMERLFDEVRAAFHKERTKDKDTQQKIRTLMAYMDGGQWLADYHMDEQGLFPSQLKRGVLSEDGLYNLLTDIMMKEREE